MAVKLTLILLYLNPDVEDDSFLLSRLFTSLGASLGLGVFTSSEVDFISP